MSLDFTLYRQVIRRLLDGTQCVDEPTGMSIPDEVRKAILERPGLQSIHIYDGPYSCGAIYGFSPPPKAFYVHYQRDANMDHVGSGWVMIFSDTGKKLYDGSDGGE